MNPPEESQFHWHIYTVLDISCWLWRFVQSQSVWVEAAAWGRACGALGVPPADHIITWNFSLWHSTCCVLALVISWTQLLNLCLAHNLCYKTVTRRFNLIYVWWFERQTDSQKPLFRWKRWHVCSKVKAAMCCLVFLKGRCNIPYFLKSRHLAANGVNLNMWCWCEQWSRSNLSSK